MHLHSSIVLGDGSRSHPSFFLVSSVCPVLESARLDLLANQEITHCCLRDPGPAKGFIDGDWTTGSRQGGLDRVEEKAAMATPTLEA